MTPRFTHLLPVLAGLCLSPAAEALQLKTGAIPNKGIFGVELSGTDSQFYARADRVLSVSWQEYTTGAYIVSEVVVDIENSSQQIRLYSLRVPSSGDATDAANRATDTASQLRGVTAPAPRSLPGPVADAADKAGAAISGAAAIMPVKVYPTTTHAHTVEYVVGSRDELLKFYSSFRDLLCQKEVLADQGSTTSSTAFGTPAGGAAQPTVNRLGGTVFSITP